MRKVENKIMLITYSDSMGNNLKDLEKVMDKYFAKAVAGIHILPFFPSSGDRGFAPVDYHKVDSVFGTWNDIERISQKYYLMFDYMINHISAQSEYYKDFLAKKEDSKYKDLFIRYKDFWENGEPTKEEVDAIYKRKPRAPYVDAHFYDGTKEKVWCTFDEEQIDINCKSDVAKQFIKDNLSDLCQHGAAIIRLDAFAYATKKAGSSCFFIEPDVWELLEECSNILSKYNVELLPEIHEHYSMQQKIESKDYYVYDFALPMLLINGLYYGQTQFIKNWLEICPRKQFTTLDTHDGIGVVDVRNLLPDEEIDRTKEDIFKFGANVKKIYNTAAYNNLDIYQVNCSYYSALGDDDDAYLLSRAVQFFAPGIPQVYYVGLLAGKNDLELLEETKVGRNINRHYYSLDEIDQEVKRPVVQKLIKLMEFRNEYPAFDDEFSMMPSNDNELHIVRKSGQYMAELKANFETKKFEIHYNDIKSNKMQKLVL
jgi:sucrose phosphorylase